MTASADLQEEVEAALAAWGRVTLESSTEQLVDAAYRMAECLRRLSQPAPTSETVLRAAAKVYMGCVHALSEFVPGKQITYFEASPTKDEECYNRWLALNEAGKVLKAAIEASATPPPPAGSREPPHCPTCNCAARLK